VHPDLKIVIELQQVDLRIGELGAQIDALPSQVHTLEQQLEEFLHAHSDRQQRLAANQKERREMEGEIQVIRQKISKHKDQLYEVKTNEQYRAMLKEIEGEEGNIRKVEDRLLEKMIEAEEIQKAIADAAARIESEKARVAAEKARLEGLRRVDIEERDRIEKRRNELARDLSESTLTVYERVRAGRNGVALAEVRDGFCAACHVCLRPQLYNDVRSNETVITCESCSRILYYVAPPADQGEGASTGTAHATA
jgi:uncharacterized protein